jgi:hypothetical protein
MAPNAHGALKAGVFGAAFAQKKFGAAGGDGDLRRDQKDDDWNAIPAVYPGTATCLVSA